MADFASFRRGVENAPAGRYDLSKKIAGMTGDICDGLIRDLRALGLKADNCDEIFKLEAAIYAYICRSNPNIAEFDSTEGFGGRR